MLKLLVVALVAAGGVVFGWLLGKTRAYHAPRGIPRSTLTTDVHDHDGPPVRERAREQQ